jgi:hypothetical protein
MRLRYTIPIPARRMHARLRREAGSVDETDGMHTTDDITSPVASVTASLTTLSSVVARDDMRLRADGYQAHCHKSST